MKRTVVAACLCLLASTAQADAMDPALSRLRIPAGHGSCAAASGFCADQELFERLVSELAVAVTTPITAPAHTDGPRGFYIGLSTTATRISADRVQWLRGSEGDPAGDPESNVDPDAMLLWHRMHVRRGLPFGVELGAAVGHATQTSLWTFGGQVKVALFEGFRHGWGALPDLSVRLSWDVMAGARALSLTVTSMDVVLSKPFVIGRELRVAPLIGGQLSSVAVAGEQVDLTPGVDAFADCRPLPQTQPSPQLVTACSGDNRDAGNLVAFDTVRQLRFRFVAGVELEADWLRLSATGMADFAGITPHLESTGRDFGGSRVAAHWASSLAAGVVF